ncbi:Protein-lysine N-methyltransferase EFM4 [Drechslerella dactyloides]|uniref:Protein-lysine N-methyltransferase EFM4 n=1 Tax=Drechslerella dactyloides TaxID=74499 RepID=A0AAD6ITT5_DREDA|nr:Protein-lysine N-methyltransferase EFM4 [Drechslerella dactyloides]
MLGMSEDAHLDPSVLGTKSHWDDLYTLELTNHAANPSDIGTVWFSDADCETRICRYLTDTLSLPATSTFLDVGTGNGHLLFSLLEDDEFVADGMVGVDYSDKSVELARNIAAQTPGAEDVRFLRLDVIKETPELGFFSERVADEGGFDVVLDKGTFDAISLSDERLDDGRRVYEVYPEKVARWVKKGGVLLITSCNWTEEELVGKVTAGGCSPEDADDEPALALAVVLNAAVREVHSLDTVNIPLLDAFDREPFLHCDIPETCDFPAAGMQACDYDRPRGGVIGEEVSDTGNEVLVLPVHPEGVRGDDSGKSMWKLLRDRLREHTPGDLLPGLPVLVAHVIEDSCQRGLEDVDVIVGGVRGRLLGDAVDQHCIGGCRGGMKLSIAGCKSAWGALTPNVKVSGDITAIDPVFRFDTSITTPPPPRAMAVGSSVLSAVAFVTIDIFVLLLIRFFLPLRTTPQYLLVPVFLALVIPCSIIVLVPIDLASNSGIDGSSGNRGVVLPDRVLLVAWRIAYWLSFVLTWAILPILQSYHASGHRDPRKRLSEAVRENIRYQIIVLTIGIFGLIYLIATNGFNPNAIKSLVIAASYFYTLTFAVFLMGHGLVAIPRNLWRDSTVAARLRRLQTKAPKIYESLAKATEKLEDLEKEVLAIRKRATTSTTAPEFREWIEELADNLQLPESNAPQPASSRQERSRSRSPIPSVITEQYLAALTRKLRFAANQRARYSAEWDSLVRSAANTQAVLDSAASRRLSFRPNPHSITPRFLQSLPMISPYGRYLLHTYVIPQLRRILSILLVAASVCIVWSEIINVHPALSKLSIVGYSIVHHPNSPKGSIGFAGQCIAAAWITYMCIAAYSTMRTVKVWGGYALVRRRTSGSSACFYASYACRLTVPLSYNFTNFLPGVIVRESVFYDFFGKSINLKGLGKGFSDWFPVLVLIPVGLTLFGFYGRVKGWFGFGGDMLEDEEDEIALGGGWRYGRDLIEREIGDVGGASPGGSQPQRWRSAARFPGTGTESSSGLLGDSEDTNLSSSYLSPTNLFTRSASPRPSQPSPSTAGRVAPSRPANRRIDDTDDEAEPEEESAIGAFFHRVKNTIDTATDAGEGGRPKWMNDIGEAFKKPRWMGGDDAPSPRGGAGSSTRPRWMTGNFFNEDSD